ncbi:transglycosylase domain-containing protein [Longispora sp. NPDC051575]|uniref:transglycosylase domain-containing protein n=1 Tax=Longispora sp. NPDC051575 TaxID=3154943 RepID=UPI003412A793
MRRLVFFVVILVLALPVDGVLWLVDETRVPPEPDRPQASTLYYSDGVTVLARIGVEDRSDVPLERVPEHLRRAVLAAEDRGFPDHPGVSARGLARAAWVNVTDGGGEGASTITQQYVKNAYLTQARTAERKSREVILALRLEGALSKDQILERYLNTIYFGRGAHGVQAAALAYFGKSVERLSLEEGAVLAAAIKDPSGFDPANDRAEAEGRWAWVLRSMAELGWAPAEHGPYPATLGPTGRPAQRTGPVGVIVDRVSDELSGAGLSAQLVRTGGLRIVTTIDVAAQRAAEDSVAGAVTGGNRAAVVSVVPGTGEVRAYYGGQDGSGFLDTAARPRPPGGAFAPVLLAAAARSGIGPGSFWNSASPRTFASRGVPLANRDGATCGLCPLDVAARMGLDTVLYPVAERVGPQRIVDLARDLGVSPKYAGAASLVDQPGEPMPGRARAEIGLGWYPVAPADLADVYATLAADGTHADRHLVSSVTSAVGERMLGSATAMHRVLPAEAARAAGVVGAPWKVAGPDVRGLGATADPEARRRAELAAEAVRLEKAVPWSGEVRWRETADSSDVWAAGVAGGLATVVWVGTAVPGPVRVGTTRARADLPAGVWRAVSAGYRPPTGDLPDFGLPQASPGTSPTSVNMP